MKLQKELLLFISLFLLLSLGMHFSAWTNAPLAHIQHLPHSSLGLWHPIYLTFAAYLLLLLLRGIVLLLKKLFFR